MPDDEIDEELERILAQRAGALTADPADATPVTVLTGFLGAGKTTLANRILSEDHGRRIAVLVNDFGEIDIDSELILGVETGQVTLANGCVCCEIRDDLIAAVERVLDGPDPIDAIVLEASGVAEPMGIARTFLEAANANRVRLDGIISVVDAEQLPAQTADPATAELVYGQIGCSDLVLLNKIDLADRPRVDEVRSFVTERLPMIRLIETTHADVPLAVLLGSDGEPRAAVLDDTHDHAHDHGFTSWVYRRDRPVEPDLMRAAISRLPGSVYRVKGFAPVAHDPGRRWLIQAVGMRADVTPFDNWDDRTPGTALVVIAAEHVDRVAVERALDEGLQP